MKINCDQVVWLHNAIDRYIDKSTHPAISRAREMKIYGCMYEIMEVCGLEFEDSAARYNGTPTDARQNTAKLGQPEKDILDKGHAVVKNGVIYDIEKVRHQSEEYEACMMAMDKAGVPRHDSKGRDYSLYGRACEMQLLGNTDDHQNR